MPTLEPGIKSESPPDVVESPACPPSPGSDAKLLLLKTELLKRIELFNPLPDTRLEDIVQKSRDLFFKDREMIFEEGLLENNRKMYVILSGEVLISKGIKRIAVLKQGEYLGEMPLVDYLCRSASARAVGNVLLMEVNDQVFKDHILSHSETLMEMMRVFSSRIRRDLDSMTSDMQRVSNFTHDMRNCLVPLGIAEALLSEAIALLRGTEENHRPRQGWDKVKRSFDTVLAVKNNLLVMIDQSLACVKKTRNQYIRAEGDIGPLIRETVEEISCQKHIKGKDIRLHIDSDVKKGWFNALDVKRVLQNLLINAGYVTEKKGRIDVHVKDLNDMIQVSVQDYGAGIPDEVKPILLKESFTTKVEGNGFGLTSCREIIEEFQHGKIWFESEVGKGTTFYFTLPHSN